MIDYDYVLYPTKYSVALVDKFRKGNKSIVWVTEWKWMQFQISSKGRLERTDFPDTLPLLDGAPWCVDVNKFKAEIEKKSGKSIALFPIEGEDGESYVNKSSSEHITASEAKAFEEGYEELGEEYFDEHPEWTREEDKTYFALNGLDDIPICLGNDVIVVYDGKAGKKRKPPEM